MLLISGLAGRAGRFLADRLDRADTAVVEYDLRTITAGVVHRRLRHRPRDSVTALELAHGRVSRTVREDLLPLLCRLHAEPGVARIVVRLPEMTAPERVCWDIRHLLGSPADDVAIEAVVTVVDSPTWLADATGDDTLADRDLRGAADDERTVAQVALSQVEFADVLVLAGITPDAWTAARTGAVLERVAPSVPIVDLSTVDSDVLWAAIPAGARRGEPRDPHGPLLSGEPPLEPDCGVEVVTFSAQRPFHPRRLHEAINVLLDGVVRARGRAWVASRPDVALRVESAGGGLGIGPAGRWLASPDGPAWADVSPERRTFASLRWHPAWGDRAQEIVIVTHQADRRDIEEALRVALLTDAELIEGPAVWATYPDPFGEWHDEPCADTESTRPGLRAATDVSDDRDQ